MVRHVLEAASRQFDPAHDRRGNDIRGLQHALADHLLPQKPECHDIRVQNDHEASSVMGRPRWRWISLRMSSASGSSFQAPVRASEDSLLEGSGGVCSQRSRAVLENRRWEPIRRPGRPRGPTVWTTSTSATRGNLAASARVNTSGQRVSRGEGCRPRPVAFVAAPFRGSIRDFVLAFGLDVGSFSWSLATASHSQQLPRDPSYSFGREFYCQRSAGIPPENWWASFHSTHPMVFWHL